MVFCFSTGPHDDWAFYGQDSLFRLKNDVEQRYVV